MNYKAENYRLKNKVQDLKKEIRELQLIIASSKSDSNFNPIEAMIQLYHQRQETQFEELKELLGPSFLPLIQAQNKFMVSRVRSRGDRPEGKTNWGPIFDKYFDENLELLDKHIQGKATAKSLVDRINENLAEDISVSSFNRWKKKKGYKVLKRN